MSHAYTAGMPTARRRRRRAILLALLAAALVGLVVAGVMATRALQDEPATTPAAACPSPPAGITVNVFNATDRAGLAGIAADALRAQRFEVGTVGNAPAGTTVTGPAEIRHGEEGAAGAQVLARYVGGAALVEDDRTGTAVDVLIGAAFGAVSTSPGSC